MLLLTERLNISTLYSTLLIGFDCTRETVEKNELGFTAINPSMLELSLDMAYRLVNVKFSFSYFMNWPV